MFVISEQVFAYVNHERVRVDACVNRIVAVHAREVACVTHVHDALWKLKFCHVRTPSAYNELESVYDVFERVAVHVVLACDCCDTT